MKAANVLDPIQDCLDATVFEAACENNPRLRDVHRKWIQGTVYRVLQAHGVDNPGSAVELVLTGSLTTYQYSADSDCDVSLFFENDLSPSARSEVIAWIVNEVDGTILPGTTHPMQCYVVPAEIEKADLYQPGLRSGFDIDTGAWIVPPDKDRIHDVEKEEHSAYLAALFTADKMDRLLVNQPDAATRYWHRIHKDRQQAMQAGKGDFADENIKYKMLANRGFFPRLEKVTGEHIAAYAPKIRRKFVYDGKTNKLIVGELAPEEGATWNHNQLAQHINADLDKGETLAGTIGGAAGNYAAYEAGGRGVKPATYERSNAALHQAIPDLDGILGHSYLPNSPWSQEPAEIVQPQPLPDNLNVDWSNLKTGAWEDWPRPYRRGIKGPRNDVPVPPFRPGDKVVHSKDPMAVGTVQESPSMSQDAFGNWRTYVAWDTTTPRRYNFNYRVDPENNVSGGYTLSDPSGPGYGQWADAKDLAYAPDYAPEHPDPWMDNEPGTLTVPQHWSGLKKSHGVNKPPNLRKGNDKRVRSSIKLAGPHLTPAMVEALLRENPQQPGEPDFEWLSRCAHELQDPQLRHEFLFETRELYPPVDFVAEGARRYRAMNGLPEPQVDIADQMAPFWKGPRVAQHYDNTPDSSNDPRVQDAYADFQRQNEQMYDFITAPPSRGLGINVNIVDAPNGEPYPSAEAQAEDVRQNHNFNIQTGLGGDHPLLSTPEYDRFRAVHDIFGHVGVGGGFDRHGEWQAWLAHMSMYQPPGRDAMASEYHGVNCVTPETRVLLADLSWKPAGELKLGDKLVGFDEQLGGRGRGGSTKLRLSMVEIAERKMLPCYRIVTDRGEITASADHGFVAINKQNHTREWRLAKDLCVGDKLTWTTQPWHTLEGRDVGYLAGILDGEGYIQRGSGNGGGGRVSFSQNPGLVLDETISICRRLNIDIGIRKVSSALTKCPNSDKMYQQRCVPVFVNGGRWETMRVLGQVRPVRLLERSLDIWEGGDLAKRGPAIKNGTSWARIESIEFVGKRGVAALQTTTRTFIAEGFPSHNSSLWAGQNTGTGKAILLPQDLITNPWDENGNLVLPEGWLKSSSKRAIILAMKTSPIRALLISKGMNPRGVKLENLHKKQHQHYYPKRKKVAAAPTVEPVVERAERQKELVKQAVREVLDERDG